MNRQPLTVPERISMNAPVSLTDDLFVAAGTDRSCYRHPHEAERCIKLLLPERRPGRFWREIRYFKSLQRRGADLRQVADYHGLVETSLGQGAVFDLVRDDDGRVSKTLSFHLARHDQGFNDWAIDAIDDLVRNLYEQWIVFHDLNPTNILAQRLGFDSYRLVVIDGIGHNHFLPLASYSRQFAQRKIVRVWNRRHRQWYGEFAAIVDQLKPL